MKHGKISNATPSPGEVVTYYDWVPDDYVSAVFVRMDDPDFCVLRRGETVIKTPMETVRVHRG